MTAHSPCAFRVPAWLLLPLLLVTATALLTALLTVAVAVAVAVAVSCDGSWLMWIEEAHRTGVVGARPV